MHLGLREHRSLHRRDFRDVPVRDIPIETTGARKTGKLMSVTFETSRAERSWLNADRRLEHEGHIRHALTRPSSKCLR